MYFTILLLTFFDKTTLASDDLEKFQLPELSGPANFIYRNFSDCATRPTPMNFTVVPRWVNKTYQVLDGYVSLPVDFGDNMMVKLAAYILVHKNWVHLTNVSAKGCQLMRNYVGPLRVVLLRAVGLPPDTCPLPRGVYRPKNIHFDMRESRIPVFPYGTFKLILRTYEIVSNILQMCLRIDFENKPV